MKLLGMWFVGAIVIAAVGQASCRQANRPNESLQVDEYKQYRAVHSYEIRPGVLISPSYSDEGRVCEIAIEKRHYSGKAVDVDAAMSSEEIELLFDELAPLEERGQLKFPDVVELTEEHGWFRMTTIPYKNVSLQMYGRVESKKYVAAIVKWDRQECSHLEQ
jgi:hypothetical protein